VASRSVLTVVVIVRVPLDPAGRRTTRRPTSEWSLAMAETVQWTAAADVLVIWTVTEISWGDLTS